MWLKMLWRRWRMPAADRREFDLLMRDAPDPETGGVSEERRVMLEAMEREHAETRRLRATVAADAEWE